MTLVVCGFAAALFAQNTAPAVSPKEIAKQDAVNEMLLDDDGVCIVTAPDGSFQIFTRGTGVYRFVDPQVELNARKVARLNAEKQLAKFISTKVEAEDGAESLVKDSCILDGNGIVQSQKASIEMMQDVKSKIVSNTRGVLNGLVTVESKKVPNPGTTSGYIQITMVYSSKTAKASAWIGKKMQDHEADLKINEAKNEARVNAARRAAENAAQPGAGTTNAVMRPVVGGDAVAPVAPAAGGPVTPVNRPEHRVNKTDY